MISTQIEPVSIHVYWMESSFESAIIFLTPSKRDFLLFRNRSEGFVGRNEVRNEGLLGGWVDRSKRGRRSRSIAPIDA